MFNELISRFRKRKQIIDATEQLVNEVKENFSKQLEEIQEAHTLPYLDTRQVPGEHPWVDNPGEVNGEINTEVYQDEFELLWQMSQSMDSNVVYCENCKKPFAKVPKAKTKCKNCGEFIYKRSMMYDNKYTPVLVGEKGLKVYDRIHKGWTSYPPDRLRQIKKWNDEWIMETKEKYKEVEHVKYEPWKWYQFLYDKYYRAFPDFMDRRFIIMEMIKVSMAFEEYYHAIGYMVNMLSYLTQYYIEQKRRIDEEDRSWYDKNEAEKYKRMVLEREINVIDLALPVYDYIDLEKILGRDETLEMFQKEVHRHGDKLKQNGFVEKFLKKVDETRKMYKN